MRVILSTLMTLLMLLFLTPTGCFSVPDLPQGDPRPGECAECSNDDFCDGIERCEDGVCIEGARPCPLGQFCDEAADLCRDTDMLSPDGGPPRDAGTDEGPSDCCEGVVPEPCQTLRCVDAACVTAPAPDNVPCGGAELVCRSGQCIAPCQTPTDCTPPAGACQRSTCLQGVCGVANCPGDACVNDCAPCQDAADCGDPPPCQRYDCIDNFCAPSITPDAPCDDGSRCFGDDKCDANGQCQAGNTPQCDEGEVCAEGMCTSPAECVMDRDCDDRERRLCQNGRCVQCRGEQDCRLSRSPICNAEGDCICQADIDCGCLDEEACRFDGDCAATGMIQRGFCEGQQCVARDVIASCRRLTEGGICDNATGICHDEICGPPDALISVSCPRPGTQVRVECDGNPRVIAAGGFLGTMDVRCARGSEVRVCCNSDRMFSCESPPRGVAEQDVVLQIQPALVNVACQGPMNSTHRVCTGLLFERTSVSCAPSN